MSAEIEHGGALDKAVACFGGRPQDWLDLSTGINPEHFPLPELTPAIWNRLPDEGLLQETLRLARIYYRLNEKASIVAAPGTQALIQLVPTLAAPSTVAVLGPTYQEHAASFSASGWKVVQCATIDEIPDEATAAVIVNPNNPDGRLIRRADLIAMARARSKAGRWLVADESFIECAPGDSVSDLAEPGLIVLRSFGKFYGLAGVRLGFMLAAPELIRRLRALQGDWPVSADALMLGRGAYADEAWRRRTEAALAERADRLDDLLARAGFQIIGGTSLFRMTRTPHAARWFQHLCRAGILTRPFDHTPNALRFGVPAERDFPRLQRALETFG